MALKESILSWIFGSDAEEVFTEEALSAAEEQGMPLVQELEPAPKESPPVLRDPAGLQLPPEHALYRLWEMYQAQEGQGPAPKLSLEGTVNQQEILSEQELKREIPRLLTVVNSTAASRLADAKPSKKPGQQEEGKEEGPPKLDAQVVLFMTQDKQAAWFLVYPPVGEGRDVDQDVLRQVLEKEKISYGVEEALLKALPEEKNKYFRLFLAAQGTQPVHGVDGTVTDMFPRRSLKKGTEDENGRIDYTALDFVHNVEKGEVICKITPPVPGVPGRTVKNEKIPARAGKKAPVPKGRNTELSPDESVLVASVTGHVEFVGRAFQVKPVMEIRTNVDYSTGNINFLGDVHIYGDVCSGFTVRAMGNVTVDGVVEAATIEAGGNLIVVKGIKGDGRAVIRAHRSIFTKYMENCVVCTKENLQTDCIIQSVVYSDEEVQVTSGRGIIVGAKVQAGSVVRANIVGARNHCLTAITLGGNPSEDFEYENLVEEIKLLEQDYEKLERQPDSPARLRNLPMIRMKLSVGRNKLKQLEEMRTAAAQKAAAEEDKKEKEQDGRQLVCGIAYPGTEVRMDDAVLRLDQEAQPCTAILEDGRICLR